VQRQRRGVADRVGGHLQRRGLVRPLGQEVEESGGAFLVVAGVDVGDDGAKDLAFRVLGVGE
jgi:hypothetical protein